MKSKSFHSASKVLQTLCSAGFESRFAGGCVRDLLLKRKATDFDIATTATPDQVLKLFSKKSNWIRAVVPTGIEHGTISVVLKDTTVEVTTLRQDIDTDGRHAKVAFGMSFEEDAARRDFTVNAMYQDIDGKIYDFFGGKKDLKSKTLKFVGNPDKRIQEDHLRILRFFRFWSQLNFKPEPKSLKACVDLSDCMKDLSRERINIEWQKLLLGKYFSKPMQLILKKNIECELFSYLKNKKYILKFLSALRPEKRFAAWFCMIDDSLAGYKLPAKILTLSDCVQNLLSIAKESKLDAIAYLEKSWKLMRKMDSEVWQDSFNILNALLKSGDFRISKTSLNALIRLEKKVAPIRKKPLPFDGKSIMKKYGIAPGPEVEQRLTVERQAFWRQYL